jgi:ABC-type nitrate/sulfonate/bicarbonate transport system substrate-binding protein
MNKKIILVIIAAVIVVLGMAFVLRLRAPKGYLRKTESITIAYSPFESTGLLWIAEDQHLFSRNGLNVTLRRYDAGVGSLDGMLNGEADNSLV